MEEGCPPLQEFNGKGCPQLRGIAEEFEIVPGQGPIQILEMKAHIRHLADGPVRQNQAIAGQGIDLETVVLTQGPVNSLIAFHAAADQEAFQFKRTDSLALQSIAGERISHWGRKWIHGNQAAWSLSGSPSFLRIFS